jgi:glycyl-tRNA synthetase beta chain
MDDLLLEIGTEEIPAGYIEPALAALSQNLLKRLTQARIDCGEARIFGTPRRLTVIIEKLAGRQAPLKTEVLGPPARIGLDDRGNPTVAGIKFAEKVGVDIAKMTTRETEKGAYLCAAKTESGRVTKSILKELLPEVIPAIPFPKTMKWGDQTLQFARPIHSILCLLGKQVVPFMLGNIKSGRYTFGHSFVSPGKIKIDATDQYVDMLQNAHVIVDSALRKERISHEITKAAGSLGGHVLPDPELVDIVNHLVEFPAVVAGTFDKKYLELPREILITAMREHQKYFAVIDSTRKLMPGFIAVNNTPARDMALVAKGHERVLRARLEDAQFFYRGDLETPLDHLVEKLKGVLFQASLGSMYAKVLRVQSVVEFIADAVTSGNDPKVQAAELKQHVSRAAFLCKADLVSQVVGEFPKLQGVMGRVYATVAKESDSVAVAIEEHYRPTYSGGPLPETTPGAILSIADKMDSICGCFNTGLIPTGASDPYALRRQGIGIVQIMLNNGHSFSLSDVIYKSLSLFDKKDGDHIKETVDDVYTFLSNRIANLLMEEGFSRDIISAIVSVSVDHIPNVWRRIRALQSLKEKPDFEPLAIAFKRVVNIIKQAQSKGIYEDDAVVDRRLFQDSSEESLFRVYQDVEDKISKRLKQGLIEAAFLDMASLRGEVDAFFDGVLVMAEDPVLRRNRLALLGSIAALFARLADFSKIST